LVEPIVNGRGRIRLGDASWTVTGPDLSAGATVEITGADGVVLQVRPLAGADGPAPNPQARSGAVTVDCPGCLPTEP
jgi:NfeD-like C-terminal, partner-binding